MAFGLLHVPLYGWAALPLDLAVGLLLGGLRMATRGWGVTGRRAHARGPRRLVAAVRGASRRRPAVLVLLLAVLALAAVVAARPPHAPPLYDGLGFPDEPYRWVAPPPGAERTPLATGAVVPVHVRGGTSDVAQALSAEQGPQVAIAVATGAFAVPAGVTSVTLRAVPRAVPGTAPVGGEVVSNLYDITATAGSAPVALAHGQTLLVNLRAEAATTRDVVICRWTGRRWEEIPTQQVGTEIYAARLPALGPVAVVRLDPGVRPTVAALGDAPRAAGAAAPPGPSAVAVAPGAATASGGPGASLLLIVLGGVVIALVAGLLVVRRRTTAGAPDADAPGPGAGERGDP